MNHRINVAKYIGRQPGLGGTYFDLYNIILPNGVINNKQHITHTVNSTVTKQTLKHCVPGIIFPDDHFTNGEQPPIDSIAYTII